MHKLRENIENQKKSPHFPDLKQKSNQYAFEYTKWIFFTPSDLKRNNVIKKKQRYKCKQGKNAVLVKSFFVLKINPQKWCKYIM